MDKLANRLPLRLLALNCFIALFGSLPCLSEVDPQPLTSATAIHALPRAEARKRPPVRIRGVVSWQGDRMFIVHDGTRGIWVDQRFGIEWKIWRGGDVPASESEPGAVLEIEGVADAGGYSPQIIPARFRRVGTAPLPAARRVSAEELYSGSVDCQRIAVEGVVQSLTEPGRSGAVDITMIVDGHPCRLEVAHGGDLEALKLVDARIRVSGCFAPFFNYRSELVGLKMKVIGSADIQILTPPAADPFLAPRVAVNRLRPFAMDSAPFNRKVAEGIVTFAVPHQFFFLQEGGRSVRVESASATVQLGDRVEVAGFVELGRMLSSLHGALVRKLGHATPPDPVPATPNQILNPKFTPETDFSGRLTRLQAQIRRVEAGSKGSSPVIYCEAQGKTFPAILPATESLTPPKTWVEGAQIELTGVCELDFKEDTALFAPFSIVGFRLWLRSMDDVRVLLAPPWWTPQRLWILIGGTGLILFLAVVWISGLRRLLRLRTARLEEVMRVHRDAELEFDSARRERLRLAVDLHDGMKQLLSAASFRVEAAAGHLPDSPDTAAKQLAAAHLALTRTQTELQECLWGLHAVSEGPPDFVQLLEHVTACADDWPARAITIESAGTPRRLSRDTAGSLLLLFQEAVGNALRHGGATEVRVEVTYGDAALDLRIADNGTGFEPSSVAGTRAGHFGIEGMRQRMNWLRGTLNITRLPHGGMEVHARLPSQGTPTDVPEEPVRR